MQLSTNFSLKEMTRSDIATRMGHPNQPDTKVIANLKLLCEKVLQPIRDHYGVTVTVNSGYRHPDVNAKVGGSKTSDHCRGQAADIEIAGIANGELAIWIRDNLSFRQCILEFYTKGIPDSGWVHVSFVGGDNKKQCLTAVKQDGNTVYLPGLQV